MADEQPQGATTGRYELLSNAAKPPNERKWKRWNDVPLWYRTLDRFGLPTFFALFLMYGIYRIVNYSIDVMDKQATAFNVTLAKQVAVTERLSEKLQETSEDTHTALTILITRIGAPLPEDKPVVKELKK